jgi:hypothetical protein
MRKIFAAVAAALLVAVGQAVTIQKTLAEQLPREDDRRPREDDRRPPRDGDRRPPPLEEDDDEDEQTLAQRMRERAQKIKINKLLGFAQQGDRRRPREWDFESDSDLEDDEWEPEELAEEGFSLFGRKFAEGRPRTHAQTEGRPRTHAQTLGRPRTHAQRGRFYAQKGRGDRNGRAQKMSFGSFANKIAGRGLAQ